MFEDRDDTIVRPSEVLGHFRRNMEREVRQRLIDEFEKAWKNPSQLNNPSEFSVTIWFDQVYPADIIKVVESELTKHGWKNYTLIEKEHPVKDHNVHVLTCRLEEADAAKYARS